MLSVCIPVYNSDVTRLVNDLIKQTRIMSTPVEIILIDDGSARQFKIINEPLKNRVKYIPLENNTGRAAIRNLFLKYARFDYLLFIDNDSVIISDNFIFQYINCLKQYPPPIVCGGSVYDNKIPPRIKMLRWKYGIKKETKTLNYRNLYPYKSFMTNNVIIHRKVLQEMPFDERITAYGHEDTLFGYHLKINQIEIMHIDNPVLNGELDDNAGYLAKTESGILNLIRILEYVNYDPDFIADITLLRTYKKLHSLGLTGFVRYTFILTRSMVRFLLVNGFASLKLFDFFKLGSFIRYKMWK